MARLPLLRLAFVLVGCFLIVGSGWLWYEGNLSRTWERTPADFRSLTDYVYEHDGRPYRGHALVHGDFLGVYSIVNKTMLNRSVHENPFVYVDPSRPSSAVVVAGPYWELVLGLMVLGIACILVTVFWRKMLLLILRQPDLPTERDWGGG